MTDTRDAIRNRDVRQGSAKGKRMIADACNAIWNRDACKVCATGECRAADACNAIWHFKACIGFANSVLHKRFAVYGIKVAVNRCIIRVAFVNLYVFKSINFQSKNANACNALRNRDVFKCSVSENKVNALLNCTFS